MIEIDQFNTWALEWLAEFSKPGVLYNIQRSPTETRLAGMRVLPGEAMLTKAAGAEYCSNCLTPIYQCTCWASVEPDPSPVTLPTAFPAAPPAPEVCCEAYYGTPCVEPTCRKEHKLPRKRQ